MFKPQKNIWQSLEPISIHTPKKINLKQSNKIKICIQDSSTPTPLFYNHSENNLRKKGRRKLRSIESNDIPLHTKDNDDNIKRKVKTHFHNFIVAYLNMLLKNAIKSKRQYKLRKLSSKITQDITIGFNKVLLNTPMKNILSQVSSKFKNKDINLYYIEKILNANENNLNINELNLIFNMTYKEMYENYYLKSTKALFQNEKIDESFETHVSNLKNKYGLDYAMKFKQNAENFIKFYICSKQRIHRTFSSNIISKEEINQKEINKLKNSLNEKNDCFSTENSLNKNEGKKFFEITRDNVMCDGNICKTQPNSSGNSCNGEDGEKSEKLDKNILGKKRGGLFNVVFCE